MRRCGTLGALTISVGQSGRTRNGRASTPLNRGKKLPALSHVKHETNERHGAGRSRKESRQGVGAEELVQLKHGQARFKVF